MIIILSPSKTLDYETPPALKEHTQPQFLADSKKLVAKLRGLSQAEIAQMMELSDKLASLNAARFKVWKTPFTPANARQAILAFKGDVYEGLQAETFKPADFAFAQEHMRILSGLYGLLRPLDLMQAYRLEMGRKLAVGKTNDLYGFWGERLAEALNDELKTHKNPVLINLASEEYAKVLPRKSLKFQVIDVVFKEKQGDKLKIIGLFAKQARGLMANYIVKYQIDDVNMLKKFNISGYQFAPAHSNETTFTFTRGS